MVGAQSGLTKRAFRNSEGGWLLSAGVNVVGSLGTRNPFERVDEFAFRQPLALAIEHRWSNDFSIEQDITFNGFPAGEFFDNGIPEDDIFYFSTNTSVKWYYSDYLFDARWLDLYVGTGVGIFTMDELNTSGNLSVGSVFWLNATRSIGIKAQATGKFAVNADNRRFDNNHFQYNLQAVFRL